jgi:hypothetical protein
VPIRCESKSSTLAAAATIEFRGAQSPSSCLDLGESAGNIAVKGAELP